MSYLLCHDSEPCHEILSVLPPTYKDHFTLLWVENEHYNEQPAGVLSTIHEKKQHKSTLPNKLLVPTVMFYDDSNQSYTRYDGVKAVQFLHNYTLDHHKNRLELQRIHTASNTPILQQTTLNVEKILDMHDSTKEKSSIKQLIKDTTKTELQKRYSTFRNEQIPMNTNTTP